MTNNRQAVLLASERISAYTKEMLGEFGRLNLSLLGFVTMAGVTAMLSLPKYEELSPIFKLVSGALMFTSTVYSAFRLKKMVGIAQNSNLEQKKIPKEGAMKVMVEPFMIELTPDERRRLAFEQEHMLLTGLTTQVEGPNGEDGDINLSGQRNNVIQFFRETLLSKKKKKDDRFGPEHRVEILEQIKKIIPVWAKPYGLSLTRIEVQKILSMIEVGSITELAPVTKAAYAILVGELLQSYISSLRADSRAESLNWSNLEAAIRSGATVPFSEEHIVNEERGKERDKVAISDEDAVRLAKSLIALSHTSIPEAKAAAVKSTIQLGELLRSEKDRRDGPKKDILDDISTILAISMTSTIGNDQLKQMEVLFEGFSRLPEALHFFVPREDYKTPLSVLRRFVKTDFGSIDFRGDTVYISAINIALADDIAAVVALLFPHIPHLNIEIEDVEDGRNITPLSLSMDAFYRQRLIRQDKSFLRRQFNVNEDIQPIDTVAAIPSTI